MGSNTSNQYTNPSMRHLLNWEYGLKASTWEAMDGDDVHDFRSTLTLKLYGVDALITHQKIDCQDRSKWDACSRVGCGVGSRCINSPTLTNNPIGRFLTSSSTVALHRFYCHCKRQHMPLVSVSIVQMKLQGPVLSFDYGGSS